MQDAGGRERVWDPLLRLLHWTLALAVLLAWFTRHGGGRWHEWLGYASLAAIGVRLAWGWVGPPHARFSGFVRAPGATLAYARLMLAGKEPRYIGHNPLGAWMIIALLVLGALAGLSGWLYTTDAFWGEQWVEDLHEVLSSMLLALVPLHVAGVALASRRHRENLAAAMLHGCKRPPGPQDVA